MESTVAFSTLMELIQVVGAFVTAPIFFNLSVIHILIISFVFNMVIGILLGGVVPRVTPSRVNGASGGDFVTSYYSPATDKYYDNPRDLFKAEIDLKYDLKSSK